VPVPLRVSGLYADDWVEDGARRLYREAMAGVPIHGPWSNDLTAWMRELPSVFNVLQSRAALEVHAAWIESHGAAYDPQVYGRIVRARGWTAQQVDQSKRLLRGFRAWLDYVFTQTDVLLMPAVPCPSPQVDQLNDAFRHALLALTTPASLAGLPVLAQPLPCGRLGLQWVCRDMDTLLRLTAQHAGARFCI
jgi:Asp-tRNA(Asn)/Glu-tRNA(Gln) amidotransferase A subunit family amidase